MTSGLAARFHAPMARGAIGQCESTVISEAAMLAKVAKVANAFRVAN